MRVTRVGTGRTRLDLLVLWEPAPPSDVVDSRAASPALAWRVVPTPFHGLVELTPPAAGPARVEIFDAVGRCWRTLVRAGGPAALQWNGTDNAGREAPAGVYLVRLESEAGRTAQRLVRIR